MAIVWSRGPFCAVQGGERRRRQGLPGGTRPGLGLGDDLLCRLMASVKTSCDAGGRTTPLQAMQACGQGDELGLRRLPPL